ncbi:MAG: phosphate uptake regulator, PhoU [Nitrososphaeraceae archaeon]|nr:phosphate uptake regulator, PhoU [Nitrososphaeraceae archaeon]
MTSLLDLGIDRISNIITDMAKLSENSVLVAIGSYRNDTRIKKQIFDWSEKLRVLQEEVSDLAIELIARYQPVASDLRFIKSCMEISYGFSRFGRYSYDIVDVVETTGSISNCDKSAVLEMAITVRGMILLSLQALQSRDKNAAEKLYEMDDTVDLVYRRYLRKTITPSQEDEQQQKNTTGEMPNNNTIDNPRCYISALLILRYLERISDHACYIGDSVHYIVTGVSRPRL